jgi:O-antigen ligase
MLPRPQIPSVVYWCFLLFVFTIPFETANLSFTSSTFTLSKLMGLLFFALYFFYCNPFLPRSRLRRSLPTHPHALWWFLGYATLYILNGSFLPEKFLSEFFPPLFTLLQLVVLFGVAANLLESEKTARHTLLAYSVASALLALGMLLRLPGFSDSMQAAGVERVTALGYNPNTLATLWALAVVALTGLCLNTIYTPFIRLLLALLTVPILVGIVNTGSRGGIGALMVGFAVYALPYWRSRGRLTAIILAVLGIAATAYIVMQAPAAARWQSTFSEGQLAGREKIVPAAMEMFSERPFLGWQPVLFSYELGRRVYHIYSPNARDAHNLFIHLFLEGGIVGAMPFLIGLWLCGQSAWKARVKCLGLLPMALFCTALTATMTHTDLQRKSFWLVLALALAATSMTTEGQANKGRRLLIKRPSGSTL